MRFVHVLTFVPVLAFTAASAQTQPQPQRHAQPPTTAPSRTYRSAPLAARPAPGRPNHLLIPGGYRMLPGGQYVPPATSSTHASPQAMGPLPSWYLPYWSHPYDWWHPRGWYGNTSIWWRDGWWFEVAAIGPAYWEWGFSGAAMPLGYGQAPPAVTCAYGDPESGRVIDLTVVGAACPAPLDVQVPDNGQ
ncbi:hypothetical protein EPN52_03970 [bacterium]|nr:MAG: hypothetical protein EPN52_03970 [bacterium]